MQLQRHEQGDWSPRSAAKILVYGIPPMACAATEISERGATLVVFSLLGIPDSFELVIAGEESPRRCVVVRKAPYKLRVAFQ
jgi:hypothetical protein